jgi:hypothetical protein
MRHIAVRTQETPVSFFVAMSKLFNDILSEKDLSEENLSTKREKILLYEKLFHNELADAVSAEGKSQIFDPKLATLVLERSYRVMSQLATGKARAISKNDLGAVQLMDLIVDKYVNPNANAQWDLLTKFRMVDMYSNIYGIFYTLVDWDVKPNGYIGPDLWLLNFRDVFPQVGAVSPDDADQIIVRTWKSLPFFERLAKQKREGYKNLDKIITTLKDKSGDKQSRDTNSTSAREESEYPSSDVPKQKGFFEVLSRYEGDRWVDVVVDAEMEFRDTKNPHDDGELPVVAKHSIPLLDDPSGMGDFERGYSMQQLINSNWNLYMDGVKITQAPPVLINKDALAVPSSAQYLPAAKWMLRTGQAGVQGAVSTLQLNPQGIQSFNNTLQAANGSLLNLFGTSDTTTTQQTEAGFGKTPKALQMQQQRENTRDNADRYFMEQYLKKVYKKFVNLISKKQSSAITLRMFDKEIEELARSYPEVEEMYDPKTGKLTIDKKKTGSTMYDYEIVSGSTFALDQKAQLENVQEYIALYMQSQTPQGNMLQMSLEQQGYEFNFGELFKKGLSNSGIQDWDKILKEKTPEEQADYILNQQAQQLQQQMAQMQAQGQTMNQVPPQPEMGMPI